MPERLRCHHLRPSTFFFFARTLRRSFARSHQRHLLGETRASLAKNSVDRGFRRAAGAYALYWKLHTRPCSAHVLFRTRDSVFDFAKALAGRCGMAASGVHAYRTRTAIETCHLLPTCTAIDTGSKIISGRARFAFDQTQWSPVQGGGRGYRHSASASSSHGAFS